MGLMLPSAFNVKTDLPAGMYGARAGAVTKQADQFALKFSGTMAHGAGRMSEWTQSRWQARSSTKSKKSSRAKCLSMMVRSALSPEARPQTSFRRSERAVRSG